MIDNSDDGVRERIKRKRAARRLVAAWYSFTPAPVIDGETKLEAGDVCVQVVVRVRAADIDRELENERNGARR